MNHIPAFLPCRAKKHLGNLHSRFNQRFLNTNDKQKNFSKLFFQKGNRSCIKWLPFLLSGSKNAAADAARKKLTASRSERVCKRAVRRSVTFFEKGEK